MSNLPARTLREAAQQLQPVVVRRQCLTAANSNTLLPIADLRRPAWLDRLDAASALPSKASQPRNPLPQSALTRRMALYSDAASSLPIDLGRLWRELRSSALRVVEMFHEDDQSYFALSSQPRAKSISDLNAQRLDIFERTLAGQSPKSIAQELSISPAQISAAVREALKIIGLGCAPSSIPLPLKLAYRAVALRRPVPGRLSHFHWQGVTYDVVSVQRVELTVAPRLDDAENALVRLVFEGCSVERIASRRGASVRTTASQVSDVLRKLRVSTRSELAELALQSALPELDGNPTPAAAP
ncbi:MAG: hypothetical protein ABW217_00520 [Polyangiaceae bacterium]